MTRPIHLKKVTEHNLKAISVSLPALELIVLTGVSGSGKSSLAFDTLYSEGQRRYVESLSAFARRRLGSIHKPALESAENLTPTIAIEQKTVSHNPRSTVGTITEIYDFLRVLFARVATPCCPVTGKPLRGQSKEDIFFQIVKDYAGQKIILLAPFAKGKKGEFHEQFDHLLKRGYLRARIDGLLVDLDEEVMLDRNKAHDIEIVIDRLVVEEADYKRLKESIETALAEGSGLFFLLHNDSPEERLFSTEAYSAATKISYPPLEPSDFSFNSPAGMCECCKGLGKLRECDLTKGICVSCRGSRLKPYPASAKLQSKTIHELSVLAIDQLKEFFDDLTLSPEKTKIAEEPLKEIHKRLSYLIDVGLNYLSLEREAPSLSGGEAQRVRLAALIGTGLVGVTYILDEPTIGLHPRDNSRLINTLHKLKDLGNTVVVVEHDEEMIASADHVIDIGPEAGQQGGHLLFEGAPSALKRAKGSLTADYLCGKKKIFAGVFPRRQPQGFLEINGCQQNNLKNLDVKIPLGCFIAVTGVSGSGKSSLIAETLFPALSNKLHHSQLDEGRYKEIKGLEHVDKVIFIDQSPIGRTPRSNPATYIQLFDLIRDLYSELPASKARGYLPGRFSFNVKEGCCAVCEGLGMIKVDMDFLEEQWTTCEHCRGKRFDSETLAMRFKGESIADILHMTVDEATLFFAAQPAITKKLLLLQQVGLGYMRLGQPSPTLSGGEAQRVKLAKELARPATGKTFYILDEPTTGLHFRDIDQLLHVLHALVDRGNSALIVEHNMDLVRSADWIIDLGPEGGAKGGYLLASAPPEEVIGFASDTARALEISHPKLNKRPDSHPCTHIEIVNAAENNLQNVSTKIPRGGITVFTGPSGSGKSSLAFATLYAEGQRRYSESLSPYARQFVTPCKKPKVEMITGLSPAITIEQKASSGNPRSTVGTLTEIYDYLRILWAKAGTAHCPLTKEPIRAITKESIAAKLLHKHKDKLVYLLASLKAPNSLSAWQELQEQCAREGIRRLFVNGQIHDLEEELTYEPKRKNQVMLCIDRVKMEPANKSRLLESLESAATSGQNTLYTLIDDELSYYNLSFSSSKRSYPPITPHTFSFNAKEGMCLTCEGLGCAECHFERMNPLARHVLLDKLSLGAFCRLPLGEALSFMKNLSLKEEELVILQEVLEQIKGRLSFLSDVGLHYISLDRTAPTLSNGEAQRIRLARQLGSGLTNVIYVLDEPTVGLHKKDVLRLKGALSKLRDLGNTLILVEHDPDTISLADWIVDMGPQAGRLGGQITAEGSFKEILKNRASLTGQYLSGKKKIPLLAKEDLSAKEWLFIKKANVHNLKDISVKFPLGAMSAITGVSGAGKSTLLHDVIAKNFADFTEFSRLALVDQNPLGQTNRADVASYTDILTSLRELYAELPAAKTSGLRPKHFSANHPSGMCQTCRGHGYRLISMLFMPSVSVLCPDCQGQRLKPLSLTVAFKGKNLGEVLKLTIDEAVSFFSVPKILKRLKILQDVGLGYLELGQEIQTLSGGEAQRIKLARELLSRGKKTLYLLDEPTNGLHFADIALLLPVLKRLVAQGHTIILIEHNEEVIKQCDWVVELGPEAGMNGGHVTYEGPAIIV